MSVPKALNYIGDFYLKQLQNPDYITQRTGKTYQSWRTLKYDAHVWSAIQQRKSGVLSLDYKFISKESTEQDDKEMKSIIEGLGIKELISMILEAPLYGFQPIEIIWEYREGKILPKQCRIQKQEYFTYDTEGKLMYFEKGSAEPTEIPERKVLNPRHEADRINPYGHAILSKCYWAVNYKMMAWQGWSEFADKFGLPFIHGKYMTNTDQDKIDELATTLANMTKDSVIVTPSDMEIELQAVKSSASKEIYNGLMHFCNTEISKAILSQTLTTEINIGSYAAANIHYKVKREVIQADINIVEKAINQLIAWIHELNGGNKKTIFEIVYTNQDNTEQIARDEKLVKMGVELTREYYMRQYNLQETDIGTEKKALR